MAARAASVAGSVKTRRDRRPPLKVAAFVSSPAPATAQPSKVTHKRQAVHKKVVSSSRPNRRGKTVTNRRKASDRSHESVGELLRRKALAAVLKASAAKHKQQKRQRQRQRKGTAKPSDMDDGTLTHQAIRKYGKSCQKLSPRTSDRGSSLTLLKPHSRRTARQGLEARRRQPDDRAQDGEGFSQASWPHGLGREACPPRQ